MLTVQINELALSRITPPPTIRSQRSITLRRLRQMQAELDAGRFPGRAHSDEELGIVPVESTIASAAAEVKGMEVAA